MDLDVLGIKQLILTATSILTATKMSTDVCGWVLGFDLFLHGLDTVWTHTNQVNLIRSEYGIQFLLSPHTFLHCLESDLCDSNHYCRLNSPSWGVSLQWPTPFPFAGIPITFHSHPTKFHILF